MNDTEIAKQHACEQFVRRRQYAIKIEKVDNSGLHAGSPMYFYCIECGVPLEVLPEDYIFAPIQECSQCKGLSTHNWLEDAKNLAKQEGL